MMTFATRSHFHVALAIWVCLLVAAVDAKPTSAHSRIVKKMRETELPYITLTTSNYTRFVEASPRTYDLILFFSVENPKYGCSICNHATGMFKEVALSYQKNHQPATSDEKPVFFAVLDYESCGEVFHGVGFTTVPVFAFHAATDSTKRSQLNVDIAETSYGAFSSHHDMRQLVLSKTGIQEFDLYVPPERKQFVVFAVTLVAALVFGALAKGDVKTLLRVPLRKEFWMVISLGVYFTSISGVIFCIIRDADFATFGKSGTTYFLANGRSQTYGEGLIVSGLSLLFFLGAITATSRKVCPSAFTKANPLVALAINTLVILVALGVCYYSSTMILSLYKSKTQWYNEENMWQTIYGLSFSGTKKYLLKQLRKQIGIDTYNRLAGLVARIDKLLTQR